MEEKLAIELENLIELFQALSETEDEHNAIEEAKEVLKEYKGVNGSICGFVFTGYRPPCYMNELFKCENCEHRI